MDGPRHAFLGEQERQRGIPSYFKICQFGIVGRASWRTSPPVNYLQC